MGKRKINTLRGKRLVTGNPNLITMNEIHVKDTQKGIEVTERDKNGKLVNVNVPTGGGDTPSQPSGSSLEYLDVSGLEAGMNKEYIVGLSRLMKDPNNEGILPPAFAALESSAGYKDAWNEVKEVCFDFSVEVNMQGTIYPIAQFLSMIGADLTTIPRITKEQFYTL